MREVCTALVTWLMLGSVGLTLDQSPMWSFRFGDKRLTDAHVKRVTLNGVEVVGSDERGRSASVVVPLGEAEKIAPLHMRVGKEIDKIRKQSDDELRARIERKKAHPGDEQAFDVYSKTPDGWIVYVCELGRTMISAGSRSAAQRVGFASGEYVAPSYKTEWVGGNQLALLRLYKNPVAEGERIVTRVETGPPRDVEVDGIMRTLRTYEVVGNDRKQAADGATQAQPTPTKSATDMPEARSATATEHPEPATDVVIVSATYGAEGTYKDVTKRVAEKLVTSSTFRVENSELGGDPLFGKVKELRVSYIASGKAGERTFKEGDQATFE